MRSPKLLLFTVLAALAVPASASADFGHLISTGESLSSVAAADGLSVSQLAAANGISADSQLIAGSTLQIPPQDSSGQVSSGAAPSSEAASGSGSTAGESAASSSSSDADADDGGGSGSGGGYTVQPGDTLSAIAAQNGTTVDQLAAANGLDPSGILPAGAQLAVSGSGSPPSSSEQSSSQPVSDQSSASSASSDSGSSSGDSGAPQPTPETVSASDVGQVAADHGVSPSLAEAIGYQESGFNNDLVSSTGATGVMQIEPGTWDYIDSALATPPPLSTASAQDNVRGGVLYLRSLLDQSGGDPSLAAAGYYQGLGSVREHGMYSDTQQYVNSVMALRQRFGGP
ncbi:MAG TPA: LysM peptidoglycan-binding domain-containing protein [Solirubrobacteraceae bacterium]|jgi:LysM repeat protein